MRIPRHKKNIPTLEGKMELEAEYINIFFQIAPPFNRQSRTIILIASDIVSQVGVIAIYIPGNTGDNIFKSNNHTTAVLGS